MSLLRWIAPSAHALALALALALSACSDDGPGTTSSDVEDDEPKPTGAVNMEVYATEEQSCPPGNIHVDVGVVNASPAKTFEDGEDGARVTCAVVPSSGGLLSASGSLEKGAASFAFSVAVESGKPSAVGEVAFTDPASGVRYASAMVPCLFQFAPGSGQSIKEGEVFVQFDCPALESEADSKLACSSRYGYVRLENCAKEAAP